MRTRSTIALDGGVVSGCSDVKVPEEWSILPRKRLLYALDTYFREGLWDIAPIRHVLPAVTFVAFKPDAVAGRRLLPSLSLLERHGFTPLSARTFTYDRLMIRETWRYQFGMASPDRVAVVDALLTTSPSLLVVFRDERPEPGCPASVRLGSLKGPADPTLRRAGQLRYELGVVSGLFNFIHTSDEPADFVRELAVLLDGPTRREVVEEIASDRGANDRTMALVEELESAHPAHDLDLERARERLSGADMELRRALAVAEAGGEPDAWRTVLQKVPRVHLWDVLTVATATIDVDVPGLEPLVEGVSGDAGRDAWIRATVG